MTKGLLVRRARKVTVGLMAQPAQLAHLGRAFELFAITAPRWHVPQLVAKLKCS